jgi:hypothetical protein
MDLLITFHFILRASSISLQEVGQPFFTLLKNFPADRGNLDFSAMYAGCCAALHTFGSVWYVGSGVRCR